MHADHEPSPSIDGVSKLGDDELIATTQRLLRQERKLSACLLVHLAEVDARQLYRQHAYSSMSHGIAPHVQAAANSQRS